jgi:hypothetical protein
MTRRPASVTFTLALVLVNALVWIAFAVLVAARMHPSLPADDLVSVIMALLALMAAFVLGFLAIMLWRRSWWGYFLDLVALILLAVLTIADDVGLADLVLLAIVVIPLLLLINDRPWYLRRSIYLSSGHEAAQHLAACPGRRPGKPTRLAGEDAGASGLPTSYRMEARSLSRRAA